MAKPVTLFVYLLTGVLALCACSTAVRAGDRPTIEIRDGDRIALVGNEFFERDQERGYIESELTTCFPGKRITFRNLGYSGDTVWADARNLCNGWATFGPPDQGFNRLKDLLHHLNPTLVFVAYGMNESFDGAAGLDRFEQGLNRLLDMVAETKARVVLVGPIRHEDLGRPLPDPSRHNEDLHRYIEAMRQVGVRRGDAFIDLYDALGTGTTETLTSPFTTDGIHLSPYGYWRAAQAIERAMGYAPRVWQVRIDSTTGQVHAEGATIEMQSDKDVARKFLVKDQRLPLAPPPEDAPAAIKGGRHPMPRGTERILQVTGLPAGRYVLRTDGQAIAAADASQWASGVVLRSGPAFRQEERLRQAVVAKNFDFFNYWRPDNDTYIFGYRQHEQGRNAVEIPRFEPLAQAGDQTIATLRVPASYVCELSRGDAK